MSKGYLELLAEQRRYRVLSFLNDSDAYRANEVLLKSVLNGMGIPTSSDRLRTDLVWLEQQGLLRLSPVDDLLIVEITSSGQDVAEGVVRLPGVKRPGPAQ